MIKKYRTEMHINRSSRTDDGFILYPEQIKYGIWRSSHHPAPQTVYIHVISSRGDIIISITRQNEAVMAE